VKQPPTDTNGKPVLNEESFQQLLSAAYVMQQQLGKEPEAGQARILAEILDTQGQIRGMRLDLRAATVLIARRARELSTASGVAIGILEGDLVDYYAAAGSAASEGGWRAPLESTLAAECVRTGGLMEIPDVEGDGRLRPELCRSLNVKAFVAASVMHAGKVAGVLELHFPQANSVHEQDVRICQLMATLVAEAITTDAEQEAISSEPRTAQRSSGTAMPAAHDKIATHLESPIRPVPSVAAPPAPPSQTSAAKPSEEAYCTCGNQLGKDELYCGVCGRARPARSENGQVGQSTWASLWDMQREAEDSLQTDSPRAKDSSASDLDVYPSELEEIVAKFSTEPFEPNPPSTAKVALPPFATELLEEEVPDSGFDDDEFASSSRAQPRPAASPPPSAANHSSLLSFEAPLAERPPARPQTSAESSSASVGVPRSPSETAMESTNAEAADHSLVPSLSAAQPPATGASPWGSARKTKEWLEAQHPGGNWLAQTWRAQRANIYLAASALLLVAVLAGWGSPPAPATGAGSNSAAAKPPQHKAPAQPDLTFAEKVLIELGLADAPPPPVDPGNPNAQVWIDVHTALYYCQGEDLYGKTQGGRITSQREAQQDQFQPAARKPCN
jgi:hypothetical protein